MREKVVQKTEFKSLTLIAILITTVMQISTIVAYKTVIIGSLLLPGGVVGFPLVFTASDIVTEVYGYKHARRILWQAIGCCAFFVFAIVAIVKLPSPPDWHFQSDYNIVFGNLPRVFLAVILGVTVSAFVNIFLFSKWKILLKGRHFWLRCFISTAIAETIITIIADITAFWGTMPAQDFTHLVVSVYLFKLVYSLLAAIPATYIAYFLKKHEGIDYYDHSTNFNPFSVKL